MSAIDASLEHEAALWRDWRERADPQARAVLVDCYLPWVRAVARDVFMRVRGRGGDWADYVQNASLGLLDAIDGFDPARGVPFQAYARQRVRGAVFNGLRALFDGPGERHELVSERMDSLLGDAADPVDAFVDAVAGLGLGFVLHRQSLPEPARAAATPYDEAASGQLRQTLQRELARLPPREAQLLRLHYLQHLPFLRIAELFGVTKGRVAQLHKQALLRLRHLMIERRIGLETLL